MRHVLFVSGDDDLLDALRALAPPSTTFLPEPDPDAALERLGRSARIDAVLTDDPAAAAAIRAEIPGNLPLHVIAKGASPAVTFRALDALLDG
jgi:hypothetical protein